ncbi:hypothetical protein DFS34DRAFT_251213 [Phlyctochytrium arcticum]|nr:hypothetical protein DFS34DRAFT_251213 [Phlyctochytrium arcticum]
MRTLAVALLATILYTPSIQALSTAEIFLDQFAYPQYSVVIAPPNHLPKLDETPGQKVDDPHEEIIQYQGHDYICRLPDEPKAQVVTETAKDVSEVMTGFHHCLLYMTGYWTYEFCPQSHVRQYHVQPPPRDPNAVAPPKPIVQHDYVIGLHDETAPSSAAEVVEYKSGGSRKGFLRMKWSQGTACELNGEPREVAIEFRCSRSALSDHIAEIRETSTCKYLMTVHTPRLCGHPLFDPNSEQSVILCRPSDTSHPAIDASAHAESLQELLKSQTASKRPPSTAQSTDSEQMPGTLEEVLARIWTGVPSTQLASWFINDMVGEFDVLEEDGSQKSFSDRVMEMLSTLQDDSEESQMQWEEQVAAAKSKPAKTKHPRKSNGARPKGRTGDDNPAAAESAFENEYRMHLASLVEKMFIDAMELQGEGEEVEAQADVWKQNPDGSRVKVKSKQVPRKGAKKAGKAGPTKGNADTRRN